jgi:hypothetical protein
VRRVGEADAPLGGEEEFLKGHCGVQRIRWTPKFATVSGVMGQSTACQRSA